MLIETRIINPEKVRITIVPNEALENVYAILKFSSGNDTHQVRVLTKNLNQARYIANEILLAINQYEANTRNQVGTAEVI